MKYVRFLKAPKLESGCLKATVTVTSDLGETFLHGDAQLVAATYEDGQKDSHYSIDIPWKSGMRAASIEIKVGPKFVGRPFGLVVGVKPAAPCGSLKSVLQTSRSVIVPAWSAALDRSVASDRIKRVRRTWSTHGKTLTIWEDLGESIACHIWDAGLYLAAYIDGVSSSQDNDVIGLRRALDVSRAQAGGRLKVVELGCGCGIVGISLAQSYPSCEVTLTDQMGAREIATVNLEEAQYAKGSGARFQLLDWGERLPDFFRHNPMDWVLVSDCTYNPDSFDGLVQTLSNLKELSPKLQVLLSMKMRHPDECVFFDMMTEVGFAIQRQANFTIKTDIAMEVIRVLIL